MDTFNAKIRQLRKTKGLTQEDVAKALGISRATLASYETGRREPDFEVVTKLANFYGVSIDYLFGREENEKINDEVLAYLDYLHKRPEMKTLFQVTKKATKEDIETAIAIIETLAKRRGDV